MAATVYKLLMQTINDPFREAREKDAVLMAEFQGDTIPMLLRHKDLWAAAKDWQRFSSDAPFRVPIPSEEAVRKVRQLPIETDPPEHTEYRALVEPFFRRPKTPEMKAQIETLIARFIDAALTQEEIEVVHDFALPIQSKALAVLLNVDEAEADEWISWGTNVFMDERDESVPVEGHSKEAALSSGKGDQLDSYIRRQLDRAEAQPGDDFFSALVQSEFRGRKLTREECVGFANLTFAGGRDTVINSITNIIAYLGKNPQALEALRANPKLVFSATEEFMRVGTPLTHIGRVCPHATEHAGVSIKADQRVSLCWAAANMDPEVFDAPEEVRLDRKPNPHVAFGVGTHNCLGALHARNLFHILLRQLCEKVSAIEVRAARPKVENEKSYRRENSYLKLAVSFHPTESLKDF